MQRWITPAIATVAALVSTSGASAQATLVGSWIQVSNTTERDGKTIDNFGPSPKGVLIFTSDGRFAAISMRADLPKFASSRENATAEESLSVVKGSLAYFGSYTVNVADKTIVSQIEGATFPNWTGTTQKRSFTLSGDQLKLINPLTSSTITFQRTRWLLDTSAAPPGSTERAAERLSIATASLVMGWSGRAPAAPAMEAGVGRRRQEARHVTSQFPNRRHRYRHRLRTRSTSWVKFSAVR
jgi:Lipocalin-like domain